MQRYRSKISGPLLDRIDLHVEVPSLPLKLLHTNGKVAVETSHVVGKRVAAARARQHSRCGLANSQLGNRQVAIHCQLEADSQQLLENAIGKLGLSARTYHRILKVARTIADLADEEKIGLVHLTEAIGYRRLDRQQPG